MVGTRLGITLHLRSRRHFIPYSWLLHAELNEAGTELYLHYTHSVVTMIAPSPRGDDLLGFSGHQGA
jgi:hypothetical protein